MQKLILNRVYSYYNKFSSFDSALRIDLVKYYEYAFLMKWNLALTSNLMRYTGIIDIDNRIY